MEMFAFLIIIITMKDKFYQSLRFSKLMIIISRNVFYLLKIIYLQLAVLIIK